MFSHTERPTRKIKEPTVGPVARPLSCVNIPLGITEYNVLRLMLLMSSLRMGPDLRMDSPLKLAVALPLLTNIYYLMHARLF
jgi:hypothetical protein